MKYDYVIIGGGIAGTTAAETIRGRDRSGTILIIASESHPLYSRVLLPNYVKERIVRDQVFLRKNPDYDRNNISVFFGEDAGALELRKNEVLLKNGTRISYGKLLLATGGTPRPWIVHGREFGTIYRMQTLEDADALLRDVKQAKSAVVVGGGFIALEFLETFYIHKVPSTLVCRGQGIFGSVLDDDGHRLMRANFDSHGITIVPDDEPATLVPADEKKPQHVLTHLKRELPYDMIGLGIGLERNLDFAKGAGIKTSAAGIITNEFLETSEEGVFAAGDIADFYDTIFERHRVVGNWTSAFLQGTAAGLNMVGEKIPFRHLSFYSVNNLGLHITVVGETIDDEAGITAISRTEERSLKYERFFIKDNRLIGGVLINTFKDKQVLERLIEGRVPMEPYLTMLDDMSFDIGSILGDVSK